MVRLGLNEPDDGVVGLESSCARDNECTAGIECALTITGAASAEPDDLERRCDRENGERFLLAAGCCLTGAAAK